mgnify:CR=1 FL=1
MKYLLPLASLLIVLLGGFFYFFKSRSLNGTAVSGADVEIPVRVARVRRISLPLKMKLTGELQPVNHTEVVSRLTGKVAEVRFKVGDFVPAGTVVATIRATGPSPSSSVAWPDPFPSVAPVLGPAARRSQDLRVEIPSGL